MECEAFDTLHTRVSPRPGKGRGLVSQDPVERCPVYLEQRGNDSYGLLSVLKTRIS